MFQKCCSTKEDAEKLDKRSVDGSESKFMQWELELQASMEKLNRLSLENPSYERENALSSADREECFVSVGQSNVPDQQSAKDPAILEKDASVDGSLCSQRSSSTIDSTTALRSPASKVVAKSNVSKSLSGSPVNRRSSNFENRKITEKAASVDMTKYVPNRISQFDDKSRKTRSSWNIGAPRNVDVTKEEQKRDNCSDTSDNLASNLQLTSSSHAQAFRNIEFLPANLSEGVGRHPANSIQNALSPVRSSILRKSASCSANSSPVKSSPTSSRGLSDSEITERRFGERLASKQFAVKTASIKELPLLSLFGRTSTLSAIRGKSCSMIDLDSKQNLKTLLDNSRLGDIQAVSAERLAYVRHKLVNGSPETKTDDVKK